jgi:hypothetical protein
MTQLQQITSSQAQPEVPINENAETLSAIAFGGKRHPATAGLVWGYYGGLYNGNTVADGTLTLTDNADNYVVVLRSSGVISSSTTSTNSINVLYAKLYKVTCLAGGVTAVLDQRLDTNGLLLGGAGGGGGGSFTGGTLTTPINEAPAVTLPSAATVNIGAAGANSISVSGTTTITAFDTIASGARRLLTFAGALTLTHNTTSLILPGAANIVTVAGDIAEFRSEGGGNWRCIDYTRATRTAAAADLQGTGLVAGSVGFREIPQTSASANYTTVASDAGKHVLHPSADTTARTFTIPANASVAYPIGTPITFVNQNGGGVITIAITTDTMRLAGAGTTGNRTLAANGIATAIKLTATEWIISGTGLT